MPITQDRLIDLIKILDNLLSMYEKHRAMLSHEIESATTSFYEANGNQNPLACDLLARLQAIGAILSMPLISHEAVATLAREREHFRLRAKQNIRVAKAMKRNRDKRLYQ